MKIRAHLKHHPLDDKRVALPGASIFAHLSVTGVIWNDIYIKAAAKRIDYARIFILVILRNATCFSISLRFV